MNFYNIQPIQIKESALKKVFGAKVDLKVLDRVCTGKKPQWLKEFIYDHFMELITKIENLILEWDTKIKGF